ncbi:MAG: hypothetical protein P8P56_11780 [Yoonia sp.]|nr:hypothetical protein [Yoonia sp.]MDG1864069.1 hypothetical protein [Yoonia sp.]
MFDPDEDGVFARVGASTIRRGFACSVLYGLSALLFYIALARPPEALWLLFLLIFAALSLYVAEKLRHASRVEILLTAEDVRDSEGRILARMDDVVSVQRGAFALKPSNGFTLVLKSSAPRVWVPGMWWRLGRRLGVGGVTGAGPSKFMAEQIALRIATRDRA